MQIFHWFFFSKGPKFFYLNSSLLAKGYSGKVFREPFSSKNTIEWNINKWNIHFTVILVIDSGQNLKWNGKFCWKASFPRFSRIEHDNNNDSSFEQNFGFVRKFKSLNANFLFRRMSILLMQIQTLNLFQTSRFLLFKIQCWRDWKVLSDEQRTISGRLGSYEW